jgi:hypothetical protein
MSISSILAFVLAAGAAAKNRRADRQDEKLIAELEAKLVEVEGERDRQYEANVSLIARIAELESDLAMLQRENAAQSRALTPVGPDFRPHRGSLQLGEQAHLRALGQQGLQALQAQQAQLAHLAYQNGLGQQYNAQQAMNAQNVGLLGAQSLIDSELFCNCVPARHDLFLRGE